VPASVELMAGGNGVETFVIDGQRKRLYTLRLNGDIEVFDVAGSNWEGKGKVGKSVYQQGITQAQNQGQNQGQSQGQNGYGNQNQNTNQNSGGQNQLVQSSGEKGPSEIVSLSVVGSHESAAIQLVAVTANGESYDGRANHRHENILWRALPDLPETSSTIPR
jgi:hypothetical protein